jgi:polar amino acid transport system substrate-binding protein
MMLFSAAAFRLDAAETITIVADSWPPYVFEENGEFKGFDYETAKEVFARLGYRVELKLLPWKRCLWMVESGQADAVLDASITDERKKTMLFPDEKISDSASVLFYLRGKNFRFSELRDLRGLRIGTILGYMYSKEIAEADYFVKEPVVDIIQNMRKLESGRIDLFISNRYVGLYSIRKAGFKGKIEYLPKPISGGEMYVAFAVTERNRKLVKDFSAMLRQFKLTAEYARIIRSYGL